MVDEIICILNTTLIFVKTGLYCTPSTFILKRDISGVRTILDRYKIKNIYISYFAPKSIIIIIRIILSNAPIGVYNYQELLLKGVHCQNEVTQMKKNTI